jgi:hypothetical protein
LKYLVLWARCLGKRQQYYHPFSHVCAFDIVERSRVKWAPNAHYPSLPRDNWCL